MIQLADRAGLPELLQERLSVPSANAGGRMAACVVAGMLAGADSIDDLDVLRHGVMSKLLVAADIIRTVAVTPTLASVAVLAVIVIIRTFLSFSLELEITGRWPWQRDPRSTADPTRPDPTQSRPVSLG